MRRLGLFLLAAIAMLAPAHAQQTEAPVVPELKVTVGPEAALSTNGYVQGQIVLSVQLLSRYPFESLDLKLPPVASASVVELLRPRNRKVTSYAGEGYVFETAIAIIPQTSGVLTIPPVTAVGHVEPTKNDERPFDLSSDSMDIKIAGVSKHYRDPWWLVSDRVEIEETWSTPPEQIRVGEAVQRTVNIRIWGITAERLPPIKHGRTRGVQVSLASAETHTEKSPEGLIAVANYVWDLEAEPQQVAFIAPIGLDYWDPIEHRARRAGVKGVRLEPLPADSARIAAELMTEAAGRRDRTVMLLIVVLGVLALPLILFLVLLARAILPTGADLRLRSAVRGASGPRHLYSAVEEWLAAQPSPAVDLDGQTSIRERLSAHLFGPDTPDAPARSEIESQIFRFSRRVRLRRLLATRLSL